MKRLDPKSIENILALTPLQEGMLFHYQKEPRNELYSEQLCLDISGTIDPVLIEKAWNYVIETNEMLRVVFRWEKLDQPSQVILREHKLIVDNHDLSGEEQNSRKEALKKIKRRDKKKTCDFNRVPFRVSLCKLEETVFEAIVSFHHILFDGWSTGLILKEFFQAYRALQKGGILGKKPLKSSFKEYIKWVRTRDRDKENRYWKEYLGGLDAQTELPVKTKKRGRAEIRDVDNFRIKFDRELTDKIDDYTRNQRIPQSAVLYAAWGILLQKYTNCNDVMFGTTVSGRSAPIKGIEEMVGLFINTIPLRVRTRTDETVRDLIYRVDSDLKGRTQFENTPLVEIAGAVGVDSGESMFDTNIAIENYPLDTGMLNGDGGIAVDSFTMEEMTNFDLAVGILLLDGIEINFTARREIMEKETTARLAGHFQKIVREMVENPGQEVRRLPIMSTEEMKRQLYDFNDTGAEYPESKTIHEFFREQAARTPDSVALESRYCAMTYRQLNDKSDGLAAELRSKGVTAGSITAIKVERSEEMVIGILGILKAGAAYLPIDPEYPEERISYMLKDSGAKLLIGKRDVMGSRSEARPPHTYRSSNPAYVIYTSGSTGKPKGVLVEHRSVVNLLTAIQKEYPLGPGDTYLLKTAYIFDVSVTELFGWNMGGGRAAILEKGGEKNPRLIMDAIERHRVGFINFVPTMFSVFLEEQDETNVNRLARLKYIFLAGEELLPPLVEKFRRLTKNLQNGIALENIYGPTEAAVYGSKYSLAGWRSGESIPIGKPLANMMLYIMDRNDRLMPVGIPGELCVAGAGLARGYLNNPQLTAEKFVPSHVPLHTSPSYKTGDLARRLPDGNIEYLGRIDSQVKIRGYRIELGEIEHQLQKHGEITETVVRLKEDNAGDKYLAAYYVSGQELSVAELIEYLQGVLPGYMIPSSYTRLRKMPLTPSGKIDRKSLPEPGLTGNESYAAPGDETEETLAGIWSAVLGSEKEKIGVGDNFFRIGGHSLKAAALVSRIHKSFDVRLPLSEVFKKNTIRKQADYIRQGIKSVYRGIEQTEEKEYYALSPAQKRLYFLQQMDEAATTYNMPSAWTLEGELDRERMEQTFRELIKRHESLRTHFVSIDGSPVQRIQKEVEFKIRDYDAIREGVREIVRPFDLSAAPLFRVGLVKEQEERHILVMDMHHIISDGKSVEVLKQDFAAGYAGRMLPKVNRHYRDYVEWWEREKEGENIRRQEHFWRNEFPAEIPVLEIPADYRRPRVQAFEGGTVAFGVGEEITAKLESQASEVGATMNMVLHAIYTIFLSKISGREDIVVGTPAAGRRHADQERITGMFVNTMPLRNKPAGEKQFNAYLVEVKEKTVEAFENQDYPYEELVEDVDIKRDTGRNPLYDTVFLLQNAGAQAMEIPGLKVRPYPLENETAKFDLTLEGREDKGALQFRFEYGTALFRRETVERYATYFLNIVAGVVKDKNRRLSELEIISPLEKQEILFDFNRSEERCPNEKTIVELYREQAGRTPDGVAVIGANDDTCIQLTYRELNEESDLLALELRAGGVTTGTIVGLKVERSIAMIRGILGILKAGAAYMPINPKNPETRTRYMMADSGAELQLTGEDIAGMLTAGKEKVKSGTTVNTQPPVSPGSIAYIIYTSGSTGRPKGVPVRHGNVSPLLHWGNRALGIGPRERALQNLAYYFDWSVWEIFIVLTGGASLYMVKEEMLLDPEASMKFIQRHSLTILHVTPTQYRYLAGAAQKPETLRYLFLGAEKLSVELAGRSFESVHDDCRVFNMYGPTEATIISAVKELYREELDDIRELGSVPIGRPVANLDLYILDKYKKLNPVNIAGELYISGDGVASGYLNNPRLTAEKFGSDFSDWKDDPEENKLNTSRTSNRSNRSYKTGDMARWLPDGNIEYLGRIDQQVKIRGNRIELGEIENRLQQHEAIKEAVVIDRETTEGEKYLCAYVVYKQETGGTQPGPAELKQRLAVQLPDYMIPSNFETIDSIPLNPNGKVDRSALPEPGENPGGLLTAYTAPGDEIEKQMAAIWAGVLGREENTVGVETNFFELGGHSLKATLVLSEIHKAFDVTIPLAQLFKNPTVRGLSGLIKKSGKRIHASINAAEKREYYPLSSAQKRLYFLQQLDVAGTGYNMPTSFLPRKDIDEIRFENALRNLIARHESLRTSFVKVNGEPVQRVHDEVEFEIENYEAGETTDSITRDFIRPFDLSKAPLIRAGLITQPDGNQTWMVDMHHIVSDGTSTIIMTEDFLSYYSGKELEPLPIQYKDFSEWQNRFIESGEMKSREDYWLKRYPPGGDIPRLNMYTDKKRPDIFTFTGAHYRFGLGNESTEKFRARALTHNATLYMNILAALNTLLHKYTGQTDIIIGSGIAGRPHAELQGIIGMFVNTLAMRNSPEGGKTYAAFLAEVAAHSVEAFENQDLQFEELVDKIELERDASRNPLFDISMVVQNFRKMKDPGLAGTAAPFTPQGFVNKTSKFDMTFFVDEEGEEVEITIEYYTGIYERETIRRLAAHFVNVVEAVVKDPQIMLKDIDIMTAAEKKEIIYGFNDTAAEYSRDKTLHRQFEEQVDRTPDNAALIYGDRVLTYRELERRSNRLAGYLHREKGLRPGNEEIVGMLLSKGIHCLESILGIQKAGGAYMPIDPEQPEERIKYMLNDVNTGIVISEKEYLRTLNRLQWECPGFHTYICLDTEEIHGEEEIETNPLMDEELWHHVGEIAGDDIEGGGWSSSYTGEKMSRKEMDEYAENTRLKVQPLLHPEARVLEMGAASGITMFRLAPQVGLYYGTDISAVIIETNKKRIEREGHRNIKQARLAAHEIDGIEEEHFDLIIMNSVIQNFPGHNYLRKTIRKSIDKLGETGNIYIGDIMDHDRKDQLIRDLREFKNANRDKGYITKTDFAEELFVSKGYWEDLAVEFQEIETVEFSDKVYTEENELTKFRYDALITVNKKKSITVAAERRVKRKNQEDARKLSASGVERLSLDVPSRNLAYVIYTSGTTGKPKGVAVEHRSTVNLIESQAVTFRVDARDRILQLASMCFDASVEQVWLPLLRGAGQVLVDKETVLDSEAFENYIVDKRITHLHAIPLLLNTIRVKDRRSLKRVLAGGDVCPVALAREWSKDTEFYNRYGPTETTVTTMEYRVTEITDHQFTVPIGRPMNNVRVYILDQNGMICPIGVTGEMYIGGDCLARGYLNNPDQGAEKFVKQTSIEGEPLLYRTGDQALWLPDGNIEFKGRVDHQVKIRGYRIELGEIQTRLAEQEPVKDAVVIDREDRTGEKYITAYIVPAEHLGEPLDMAELTDQLSKELPDYMIPAYFVELETLPLTSTGKVDRKKLPDPEIKSGDGYVSPRNERERKLVKIWAEVLGREAFEATLGIDDNFFQLGGHSLKATILMSKIHKAFNVKVPLVEIFTRQTIRELATYIREASAVEYCSIEPAEEREYYPLSSAQERLYILQQMEPDSIAYNMPQYFTVETPDLEKLEPAFRKLIRRHESLRTSFTMVGKQPVQKVHDDRDVGFEIRFNGRGPLEFARPFDLGDAPLLRVGMTKIEQSQVLMVDMHHIIADGISMNLLVRDFVDQYKGNETQPLRIQYKDFAQWQDAQREIAVIKEQEEFWLNEFSGKLPLLELPLDYPRPAEQSYEGDTVHFIMAKEEVDKMKKFARKAGYSLYMVNQAIYNILLHKLTGQQDIIIGTDTAGRGHADLQQIMGMFVNTLALRNFPGGKKTFIALMEEIKERTLQAFENQDYPFEELVGQVVPERDVSRNPLFDSAFYYHNEGDGSIGITEMEIPGLGLKPYKEANKTAKFDLTLSVQELGDSREEGILAFEFEYGTRLFKKSKIESFGTIYREIAAAVMENPGLMIKDIEISYELLAERQQQQVDLDDLDF